MTTKERIAPIVTGTYGNGSMPQALVDHLAARIDEGDFDMRGREHAIFMECWNWFGGGGTAEGVARKIEEALSEEDR